MATATATAKFDRAGYRDQLKAAENATQVKTYEDTLENYRTRRAEAVALAKELRQLHINSLDKAGAEHVASAVAGIEYDIDSFKRTITDYETRIAKLKGQTVSAESDD